jgi:protoporphyrinogen oxidase
MPKSNVLILGAGPSGMAAGMELYKKNIPFEMVEKNAEVGGLARTLQFGKFRTDIGPHRFFSKNPYLYSFIGDLLGEKWILVKRFTRFYSNGKLFKYPNDLAEIVTKFGILNLGHALADYAYEKIRSRTIPRKMGTFEEYAVANFGHTLAKVNILNYTQKVWGIPCSQISVEWAKQRIKGLSLRQIFMSTILHKSEAKSLVDEFYYPETGTGLIYETIRQKVEKENPFHMETWPVKVEHEGKRIRAVHLESKTGKKTTTHPEHLLTSIPITQFVRLLDPQPPAEVLTAASRLAFRSQVYVFMTLNKPHVSPDQWIYFPNKEIPFGRISEMKNFSEKMSPPEKTSLFIEFFCWENDSVWKAEKKELEEKSTYWLEKLGFVKPGEVENVYIHRQRNVYPVYDLHYEKNLDTVKAYLNGFENLEYIGRPGRFRYTNQDHSLEMGILAARSIIERKKYDLDKVGSENEYFEKGTIGKQNIY